MSTTALSEQKRGFPDNVNFICVSIFFGAVYWILEAVRDVISFNRGHIFERIFTPDLLSIGMRLLVVMLLLLFGAYGESIRTRHHRDGVRKFRMPCFSGLGGMIWAGFGFAVLYWALESLRDVIVFQNGTFIERFFVSDMMGIGARLLSISVLLLFSAYAQSLVNETKRAEQALIQNQEKLEKMVDERTQDLLNANALLKQEISERKRFERESERVNRALKTLSACNEELVRAADEAALLDRICRKIVHMGGYDLVWVALAHQNGEKTFQMKSGAALDATHFALLDLIHESEDLADSPIGYAVAQRKPVIMEHLHKMPSSETSWLNHAKKHHFGSMISLPLMHQAQAFGALNILCTEKTKFDEEEVRLLRELANDLSYGVNMMRTRMQQEKAEQEKIKIQAQLLQSQKMEAVGMLAGGVAHDFNNLLTAIQVSADLGRMEVDEAHPAYKEFSEIHQVAGHAAELAKQLLLFSRKHPMEPQAIALNDAIDRLHKMLKRLIGEGVVIRLDFEPRLWHVWADQGTLEQVIVNLVVNARDAVDGNGNIRIRTENVTLHSAQCLRIPESRPGHFVRIAVEDDGAGMSQTIQEHIFEPFFSTKSPAKGSGLGLSVVYGIIKEHEGFVRVRSEEGKGTRFEIYLPAIHAGGAKQRHAVETGRDHDGGGKHVLFVEDEEKVREFTSTGLKMNGYHVHVAENGREAEAIFEKYGRDIDIVFSDIVLPDDSGIVLSEKLMQKKMNLKVILSSGYSDKHTRWPGLTDKGFAYLQKPYTLHDVLNTLKTIYHA